MGLASPVLRQANDELVVPGWPTQANNKACSNTALTYLFPCPSSGMILCTSPRKNSSDVEAPSFFPFLKPLQSTTLPTSMGYVRRRREIFKLLHPFRDLVLGRSSGIWSSRGQGPAGARCGCVQAARWRNKFAVVTALAVALEPDAGPHVVVQRLRRRRQRRRSSCRHRRGSCRHRRGNRRCSHNRGSRRRSHRQQGICQSAHQELLCVVLCSTCRRLHLRLRHPVCSTVCSAMPTFATRRASVLSVWAIAGFIGASRPPRHAARLVHFAKIPHGPDPLRKDQVGPGGLLEPNGYGN